MLGQRQYPFVMFSLDFSWNQNAPNKSGKIQHWRDVMFVCPVNNQQGLWYPGIHMIIYTRYLVYPYIYTLHNTMQYLRTTPIIYDMILSDNEVVLSCIFAVFYT